MLAGEVWPYYFCAPILKIGIRGRDGGLYPKKQKDEQTTFYNQTCERGYRAA